MVEKDEISITTVNLGFHNLVMTHVNINKKKCLLDSGASASIIPKSLVGNSKIEQIFR